MSDLFIYCLTSKKYNLFKYLPSNIIPLGLGNNVYPKDFLNEKFGINITKHNKYLAEMTGIYWVYKNQINKFKKDDWIGFCHYRRFWLNDYYNQNHKIKSSLYSQLLIDSEKFKETEEILKLDKISPYNRQHIENIWSEFLCQILKFFRYLK